MSLRTVLGLGLLVLVSWVLRSTALDAGYWIDEGLSVGIASHPLSAIPGLLRQDGSPPFYYLLLHVWMALFGNSETATHALSLVFALILIPVAYWAGRTVRSARVGWFAATLAATNSYVTYYAQETRMYTLVVLLGTVAAALLVAVFLDRRRGLIPALALTLAALSLTHNWGLFVVAAALTTAALTGHALAPGPSRRAVRVDVALTLAGVVLLYLPWLGTLLSQVQHTGAPWARRPDVATLLHALTVALGGAAAAIVVLLGGVVAAGRLRGRDRDMAGMLASLAGGTLLLAFLASQLEPAWATRYVAVAVGPLILLTALVLGTCRRIAVVALAALSILGLADPRTERLRSKDSLREAARQLTGPPLSARDLVVSAHPERGPLIRHYLGGTPRYADLLGPVTDPQVFDWREAPARLRRADPGVVSARVIASLRPGGRLVLVAPDPRGGGWDAPWTRLVRWRAGQWQRLLDDERSLRQSDRIGLPAGLAPGRGVTMAVYRRVAVERPARDPVRVP